MFKKYINLYIYVETNPHLVSTDFNIIYKEFRQLHSLQLGIMSLDIRKTLVCSFGKFRSIPIDR